MTEIIHLPPSGNPIDDTKNLQTIIDKAVLNKKPVIIQLSQGDYHLGYLINNTTGTEHSGEDWNPDIDFSHRGLILKSIPLSEFDNNRIDAFIEIRGNETRDSRERTRVFRMTMPVSPILGNPIYDDVNRLYLRVLQSTEKELKSSLSGEFSERIKEINKEDSDFARFIRKANGASHGREQLVFPTEEEKNAFVVQLIQQERPLSLWLAGLKFFRFHRSISTDDTRLRGAANSQYTNDEDSALIRMTYLNYNGRNVELAELGWETSNYQLEQNAGIIIYANSSHAGKFRFNADNLSFEESTGDGIHLYKNCSSSLSFINTLNNSRGGITITGQHADISLYRCYGRFTGRTVDGISVEIEKVGYSNEFVLDIDRCSAKRIKFTLQPNNVVNARRILTYGYFSQSSYDAILRIADSSFINKYEGDFDATTNTNASFPSINLSFPGDTIYFNCTFTLRRENSSSHIRRNPLVNVRTKRGEFGYRNQHIQFISCTFRSFSSNRSGVIHSAIHRSFDPTEENNVMSFEDCRFTGVFKSIFSLQGGKNRVISSSFDHPVVTEVNQHGIFYFHSQDRKDVAFHAELEITGDLRESNFGGRPFIRFVHTSNRGVINCIGTRLRQDQNVLVFQQRYIDEDFRIFGFRTIEASSAEVTNPDGIVDGLQSDILNIMEGEEIVQRWRCIQSGDNSSALLSKWQQIN